MRSLVQASQLVLRPLKLLLIAKGSRTLLPRSALGKLHRIMASFYQYLLRAVSGDLYR